MKIDGRTLSHAVSETIRLMAVRRVREGERPRAVIRSYGLCRTTVYRWLRAEAKGGEEALKARKHPGPPCKLTEKQRQEVRRWICGKDPRQYGFDFGLWTRRIVADLVEKRMKKRIGLTAVGRMLARLEITPQKPLRRAYERDPVAVERWKQEEYPQLKKRAKRCGADIFFLDEAGVRSDAPLQRTWGAKGQTPVVRTSGQRQSVNAISAVNARGAFWYNVYTGRFNSALFLVFLRQFLCTRRRPVFLVVDGHPAHKADVVRRYVQSRRGRLELHFLPGYAPDLNPDEFVWNHLRQNGTSKKPLRQNESLRSRVEQDLAAIQNDRPLVRSFFRAESVAYTTD
jgi:transposase